MSGVIKVQDIRENVSETRYLGCLAFLAAQS